MIAALRITVCTTTPKLVRLKRGTENINRSTSFKPLSDQHRFNKDVSGNALGWQRYAVLEQVQMLITWLKQSNCE